MCQFLLFTPAQGTPIRCQAGPDAPSAAAAIAVVVLITALQRCSPADKHSNPKVNSTCHRRAPSHKDDTITSHFASGEDNTHPHHLHGLQVRGKTVGFVGLPTDVMAQKAHKGPQPCPPRHTSTGRMHAPRPRCTTTSNTKLSNTKSGVNHVLNPQTTLEGHVQPNADLKSTSNPHPNLEPKPPSAPICIPSLPKRNHKPPQPLPPTSNQRRSNSKPRGVEAWARAHGIGKWLHAPGTIGPSLTSIGSPSVASAGLSKPKVPPPPPP